MTLALAIGGFVVLCLILLGLGSLLGEIRDAVKAQAAQSSYANPATAQALLEASQALDQAATQLTRSGLSPMHAAQAHKAAVKAKDTAQELRGG